MIDNSIKQYIDLISSITPAQSGKKRITDFLIERIPEKKEISGKYVVAASALAFVAVGTYLLKRNTKQDLI